ncbi:MAG: DUF91 domain-containing protein [Planctomycetes bacterium]|nr:DUF91 domain-containing protein [Planctomycetota bacterium]
MRLFGIEPDDKFREFVETPFQANHEESVLEGWLESNPDGIVEDGALLIIGRQVSTNLGSVIDLLGIDRRGDVVVLELKRDRTPRDTLAQSLEYASFVEQLDAQQLEGILCSYLNDESASLADYHRQHFQLGPDEAIAFNKDQRIVIVGQGITSEIRQTSLFLRSKGIRITCVEFSFFEAKDGTRLLSHDIVVGKQPSKPTQVASGSLPIVTEEFFVESLDEYGRQVFKPILDLAAKKPFPIHWGTKGFSLNVDLEGAHVVLCFGYPPDSVYRQSLYTALISPGGLLNKTQVPENIIQSLRSEAVGTGLFRPAGRELKCVIDREFSEDEIGALLSWCEKVACTVRQYGLKQ